MNTRQALAALLILCAFVRPPAALGAESSAVVTFGKGTIVLPEPDGFAPPSSAPQAGFHALQHSLPSDMRLMALIIDEVFLRSAAAGEHTHLSRYFVVHTDRTLEMRGITRSDFAKVKGDLSRHAAAVIAAGAQEAQAGAARASLDLARDSGDAALSVKPGDEVVLGVIEERPDSISVASLSTVSVATKDGQREFRQVVALACVRIHGRALSASVYSDVDSPDDVEWAKQALHDWVLRLDMLNASQTRDR